MSRNVKDRLLQASTYISSALSVIVLAAIIIYLVVNGVSSLSMHLLTGDYYAGTANSGVKSDYVYNEPTASYDGLPPMMAKVIIQANGALRSKIL